jgi:hemin uptake protein HemP
MNKSSTPVPAETMQAVRLAGTSDKADRPADPRRLCSVELFSGARELVIEHAGGEYRLRQTSQGKLILTK